MVRINTLNLKMIIIKSIICLSVLKCLEKVKTGDGLMEEMRDDSAEEEKMEKTEELVVLEDLHVMGNDKEDTENTGEVMDGMQVNSAEEEKTEKTEELLEDLHVTVDENEMTWHNDEIGKLDEDSIVDGSVYSGNYCF